MKTLFKTALLSACLSLSIGTPAWSAEDHLITMHQADIRSFIDDVSIVTGKTFLVDPRVQGQVTISSEQTLSPNEVFTVFKDVLRVHGYTAIRTTGGEYRITLLQNAAQDAPFVTNIGASGQLATTVIKLNYVDAATAAKLIKPVLHAQGILTAAAGGDILVVTDFPENLKKARAIVELMDSDGTVIETLQLTNLSALDAETVVKKLVGPRKAFKVVAVPGSNQIILEGDAHEIAQIKPVLQQLDLSGASPRGAVSVVPLRFADGTELIDLLTSILPAYAREGQPEPTVAHDPGSNTIVISAVGETQQALEQIIRQLDHRRPQVLVEAIIVEISDTAARDLGVEFALGGINSKNIPFIGTNFSRQAPDMLALAGAIAGESIGLSDTEQSDLAAAAVNSLLGLQGGTIGGVANGNDAIFSAILTAIESDDDSNVLSTPFVTTLDNVKATFLVGKEIPITTGESLGSANINPFRTYDREEVGIKLDVLPQISEGDVIRLEIKQEVSSIAGALTAISSDFITNKREIGTTVLANDGEIIVLGGLIQDDEQINLDRVPLLGSAPVIGKLFQSESKSRARTTLMVFLRPTIIRDETDARPLTERRLQQIRREDMLQSGREISKFDQIVDMK